MSETAFDYSEAGAPSVSDRFFNPSYDTSTPPEIVAEDEFETAAERVRDGAEYVREQDDWFDYLEAAVSDYEAAGLDPLADPELAAALSGPQAQAYWQQREAEEQYEDYVAEVAANQEGERRAAALIERFAKQYDVPQSGRDGTVRALATEVLGRAQREAYDAGDLETLEQLRTPSAAMRAIEAGAIWAKQLAAAKHVWSKGVPAVMRDNPEWAAKVRAEFEDYAERRGIERGY